MSDFKPHSSSVSLDDLLRANKDQFDRIFSTQMAGGSQAEAPAPGDATAARADATAALNARFGNAWSSEVVEHKNERGLVTVLCRLTVDGVSKMQFGSARANGDAGSALRRATDAALANCAAMFADAPPAAVQTEDARRPEPGRALVPAGTASAPQRRAAPARAVRAAAVLPGRFDVALRNARDEMELVLAGTAMTVPLRDGYGQAALIADAKGRMLAGRFSFDIAGLLEREELSLEPGDVLLLNDPYACGGAVSGLADWLVLMPVYDEDEPVGFTAMRGQVPDAGGPSAGGRAAGAASLFAEGVRIRPLKLFAHGELNHTALQLILGNTRTPTVNRNELMAMVDACQAGAARIGELCRRYGRERYVEACEALLAASNRAMRRLIVDCLSVEPLAFEDVIDDDGLGNGPFRLRLTVWREGEQAYFDWTGTANQAPGPVNFFLNEGLFKQTVAMYLIARSGRAMALNDGIAPLIHVTLPRATLLRPDAPAPLGLAQHAEARSLDVLGGALAHGAPDQATAAGYGGRPWFRYSGRDGNDRPFVLEETLLGGLPGRPAGDGPDGHSQWPHRDGTPTEHLERHFPLRVERRGAVIDSGGAGQHRGGNGVETVYLLQADGELSLQDERRVARPWGLLGGGPGAVSAAWLEGADGEREDLPAKVDGIAVRAGQRLILRTAGGGGWGDPLARDPRRVRDDVVRGLVGAERARERYGVVLHGPGRELDMQATEDLRDSMRRNRRTPPLFAFGGRRESGRGES